MELSLGTLFKKKVSEEKVAELFTNIVINSVDEGFADVAELVNNDLQFERPANIAADNSDAFLMIVITGNILNLPIYFEQGQEDRIEDLVMDKLATIYEVDRPTMDVAVHDMQSFFGKINYPSKKTLYAMSKALFYKYHLNAFQKPFFRDQNVPDPIFLKHVDAIMEQFMVDWDKFTHKFKITDWSVDL